VIHTHGNAAVACVFDSVFGHDVLARVEIKGVATLRSARFSGTTGANRGLGTDRMGDVVCSYDTAEATTESNSRISLHAVGVVAFGWWTLVVVCNIEEATTFQQKTDRSYIELPGSVVCGTDSRCDCLRRLCAARPHSASVADRYMFTGSHESQTLLTSLSDQK
jgi:hypothetical protein